MAYINWNRIFAKSNALEASERLIAVSMFMVMGIDGSSWEYRKEVDLSDRRVIGGAKL